MDFLFPLKEAKAYAALQDILGRLNRGSVTLFHHFLSQLEVLPSLVMEQRTKQLLEVNESFVPAVSYLTLARSWFQSLLPQRSTGCCIVRNKCESGLRRQVSCPDEVSLTVQGPAREDLPHP